MKNTLVAATVKKLQTVISIRCRRNIACNASGNGYGSGRAPGIASLVKMPQRTDIPFTGIGIATVEKMELFADFSYGNVPAGLAPCTKRDRLAPFTVIIGGGL